MTTSSKPAVSWAITLLLAASLFFAGFLLGRATAPESPGQLVTSGPLGEQARRAADDPFALGSLDAPVTMVVFSDYRCPFCARYSRMSEPEIVQRFVDTGQLRLEWRDFPIFGDASILAARAGRAAADQGKFWEFNRAVFAAAPESGHHDLTPRLLVEFAEQAGVADLAKFEKDMHSDRFDTAIAADVTQGRGLSITGTPSFVIDGNAVVGAQPTSVFVGLIQQALAGR
jgi:protein-disulfide isomerase